MDFDFRVESREIFANTNLADKPDSAAANRLSDEYCNSIFAAETRGGSAKARINVILVDTIAFPGHLEADLASNLFDEVLEFHHGRDLPAMMKMLKNKYPGAEFDITTDTHGNHGSKKGFTLWQKNGTAEYVKYGELEESLAAANIHENSVRIFYGGCNAATGYFNAKLSDTAKRYENVTYGAASVNERGDDEPVLDFLRIYEKDPHYGLLSKIKKAQVDESNAHVHKIPLHKEEYKTKLAEIARLRKSHPQFYDCSIRKFAQSYQQSSRYYR